MIICQRIRKVAVLPDSFTGQKMGTKDTDDPMDLGPFFQSYVLQNPFSSLMVTPKKEVKIKSNIPKPKVLPPTTSTLPHDTKCNAPVLPSVNENGRIKVPMTDITTLVVDTPKAHIGSNFHFAMMLRHFKVSDIHRDIQKWLWDEYRYVKEYSGQLPQVELLTTIQKQFPELTSSILSRVMKFTFPTCPKTLNKLGTFYTGLVRRPKLEDYHNIDALRAADHVHSTTCGIDIAASVYQVSEATVASIHYWRSTPSSSLHSLLSLPNMVEMCDDNSGDSVTCPQTADSVTCPQTADSVTCHQNADTSDSDTSDSPSRTAPHKQPYVSQQLHFRNTNGMSVVANGVSNADRSVDEWTGGSGPADSTDSHSSYASSKSQACPKRKRNSSSETDLPDKRIKPENGNSEWNIRLTQANDNDQCPVTVKEEQVDPAYSNDMTASTLLTERITSDSRLMCPKASGYRGDLSTDSVAVSTSGVHQQNGSVATSSSSVSIPGGSKSNKIDRTSALGLVSSCTDSATDAISSTRTLRSETICRHTEDSVFNDTLVQSVDSNHALRRRMEDTQRHLVEQQEDSARLTHELAAAKRRIQLLEHSLDARNTQLTQLAEEFFAFGDKFQQLSRHFQLALIGITEPSDRGNVVPV